MKTFKFMPTTIPDVVEIQPPYFGDERGAFMETWNAEKFRDAGLDMHFVQDNFSRSVQGTLRGLHYQTACAQGKLVRVYLGEVFDVAVDLRRWSPTFGKWVGAILSAKNRSMLWVPPGFAHGFYVMSESAEFVYKCTDRYAPEYEAAIRWDDPNLNIAWPILKGTEPLLSKKDQSARALCDSSTYAAPDELMASA